MKNRAKTIITKPQPQANKYEVSDHLIANEFAQPDPKENVNLVGTWTHEEEDGRWVEERHMAGNESTFF